MNRYSRVFRYISSYKRQVFLYIFCTLLSIIFSIFSVGMLLPFLQLIFLGDQSGGGGFSLGNSNGITNFINKTLSNYISLHNDTVDGKLSALAIICGMIIGAIFLKNLFIYLSYYILNPLKNRIVTDIRAELYNKILHLPIGYFTEKRKGDLISRITNDLNEVENSVVGALEGYVRDPLTIIFNLVVMLVFSVKLTLFIFLLLPIVGFVIGRITKSLKAQSKLASEYNADSVSVLDETLGGLRVIKAFNLENLLRSRFFGINNKLLNARNQIGYRRDAASPASEVMGVMVFCIILYFGGRLVLGNSLGLDAGTFLTYLALFYNIINPAKSFSTSFGNLQKGSAAIARIDEVMHASNTVDDNPSGKKLEGFHESIEFRNVSFAYEGHEVLKNINLTIRKGQTVALVGSSGAGKSTLADLVPRFHDVTGGSLLIDGVDIREYSLKSVRDQISIVTQEPILFNDSIEGNILMGKQEASQEEVVNAAKVANAHNYISQKEEGYQTGIGDRGSKLSGGERQRLTIARAVLKNPPILILDEATSSLDTESERLVQDAINNMMHHRTSLVIAHRLSTIRHADEIIVLQKGSIVERGTHEELLARGGYYHKLIQMQEVK